MENIVITAATRTAMGGLLGQFKDITAPQLGATVLQACLQQTGIKPENVDHTIMGCVLPAGLGQAPARQASLLAGLSYSTGCVTVNKMCGSAMQAIIQACDAIQAGNQDIILAGGMENMTRAPYLMAKARQGYRFGHAGISDHMLLDGLEDAYEQGLAMGVFAERCVERFNFSRDAQDEFAVTSLNRAKHATDSGIFAKEITPLLEPGKMLILDKDEQVIKGKAEKIPQLKPTFKKDGTITAANASSISDGAAALMLMTESKAQNLGLTPLAKIVAHTTHAQEPQWFTTAPIVAINKVLAKADWSAKDVDLYEINEAFACVTMAAMHELKLPLEKVNIHGGACALGHPIGASGARIVVTLLNALTTHNLQRGVATLCIGGGEATALAVERFI